MQQDKIEHVEGPFYRFTIYFVDKRGDTLGIDVDPEPIAGKSLVNFSNVAEVRDEVNDGEDSVDPNACVIVYQNGTSLYVKLPREEVEKIVLDVYRKNQAGTMPISPN